MAKVQIEILEEDGVTVLGEKLLKGDRVSADSEVNPKKFQYFVGLVNAGLAKNVETGEAGERKPGAVKLNVHDVKQPVSKAQVK